MHHQSPRGGIKGKMFFVLFLNRKSHHFNVWRFVVDYAEILPLDWTVQCTQSQVRVSFFQMSNLTSRYFNTLQNLISLRCRTDFVCSVLSLEPVPPICVMSGTGPPQSKHRNDLEHPVMMGMRIDIIKISLNRMMVMVEEWNKKAPIFWHMDETLHP